MIANVILYTTARHWISFIDRTIENRTKSRPLFLTFVRVYCTLHGVCKPQR